MIKKKKSQVDVTAFIRELLFGHDCVIVPGFGGFIGNYTPARIDKTNNTFYPPVKQISFNRNLDHNDGLLIGHISKFAGINYGDSRNIVSEFVADVRKKLDKGEKVRFENIGSFINNHEGNIQFEPDRHINYLLDSYGLEAFQCLPLEGYDVRRRIINNDNENPIARVRLKKVLWRAAVVVPLLSLLVLVKTDFIKSKVEATTMNPLVTAEFENNKTALDEGNAIDLKNVNDTKAAETGITGTNAADTVITDKNAAEPVAQKTAEPVDQKVAAPVTVSSGTKPYYVITGSFKSKENADVQADMLREAGFEPEVVTADNGFFRVCATTCTDLEAAVLRKDMIAQKFPGSWISRKK